jgi:hypothetical protein
VKFTDGICEDCAVRFRAEMRVFVERRRREAARELPVRQHVA